ncbi:hypothetical protein MVEN_01172100 [Mycena venus]|uniref:DUF6535 domain-containing protein n=1 Tax=Mycena venus TaxID=2733690 RepID=A0A8H7CYI0_9AGAR|nr:hypothetical protein MVEN_01172100 [Mycena venus]
MTNERQGPTAQQQDIGQQEPGAAKLWTVYVSEAEKYDRSLVESWKSDMERLLIFAALFSAILTAFLIESYKSLSPDSGDLTVLLLAQISQQLAASANGTTFNVPPSPSFAPSAPSLICNGLWFMSLGFSLACALIATFVQQWARDFLHKADMRSAPVIRARIFSYLYYGLKRFQMHTVVEIIPLLLHGSLLLFFSGLIAFLIPVNHAMTAIAGAVLAFVSAVYCTLTLLPLLYLDCPYRTPLSGGLWRASQALRGLWHHRHALRETADESAAFDEEALTSNSLHGETMVEAMSRTAVETRSKRDYKSLVWTMKSLSDDLELEPFIEAIPDVLGSTFRQNAYETHIRGLIQNPETRLLLRIVDLFHSCNTGLLSLDASRRRMNTCFKALWAIGTISKPASMPASNRWDMDSIGSDNQALDLGDICNKIWFPSDSDIALSTQAVMLWSVFRAIEPDLREFREYFATCSADQTNKEEVTRIQSYLFMIHNKFHVLQISSFWPYSGPSDIPHLRDVLDEYLFEIPHRIFLNFLSRSLSLESPPYRWQKTRSIIRVFDALPIRLKSFIEGKIDDAVLGQLDKLNGAEDTMNMAWIDESIAEMLSLWVPDDNYRIPRGLIMLLNRRSSVLNQQFGDWMERSPNQTQSVKTHLWNCFQKMLLAQSTEAQPETFTAMWHLVFIGFDDFRFPSRDPFESVLTTLSMVECPMPLISCSIIALLKVQILWANSVSNLRMEDVILSLNHPLLPTDSGIQVPEDLCLMPNMLEPLQSGQNLLHHRSLEASLDVITEYFEYCDTDTLPYNTIQTLNTIKNRDNFFSGRWCLGAPEAPIHATLQIRLANSIHAIFVTGIFMDLMDEILNSEFWDLYAEGMKTQEQIDVHLGLHRGLYQSPPSIVPRGNLWPWLEDASARQKIIDAFTGYEGKLTSAPDSARDILPRLRRILRGIDCWHVKVHIFPVHPLPVVENGESRQIQSEGRPHEAETEERSAADEDRD